MNPLPTDLFAAAAGKPVLVGFSGGLDSTVLLHLLAIARRQQPGSLRAIHVHHGLQPAADDWARHCSALCRRWNIALEVVAVQVADDDGEGIEAAARKARHAAFKAQLQPGEWLALAHHQDDQAETFLLRALRSSGVDGLAAMRPLRPFGQGRLWRPLLALPLSTLQAHARQHQLEWIEDPSNASSAFDRNFLRLQLMPLLRERWPQASAALARSAALAAQASELLGAQDAALLHSCLDPQENLLIAPLLSLPASQRARVLRLWGEQRQLPPLPANGVASIEQLLLAGHDRQASFRWRDATIVRWRDRLHVQPALRRWPAGWQQHWDGSSPALLPDGGVLSLHGAAALPLPVLLRQRQGGERIQLPGRAHSHQLKHCLQQLELPPWLRTQLPLLCAGEQVLAAADQVIGASLQHWLTQQQARLHWQRPDTSIDP